MKNMLIIGATGGIGSSLTQILKDEGHQVLGTYHSREPDMSTGNVQYHHLNVLDEDIDIPLPWDSLDGLAYCPGSINLKPFSRITPASFADDYRLNLIGAVKVIQAVLPKLRKSKGASVVLFSTVAAGKGFNFHSQVAASKGAVQGLTYSLAAEFAPTIRFNCIAPSLTNTPLASALLNSEDKVRANDERHPLGRIGQPEDIAQMAAFLLSDQASWITGQVHRVDGGMSSVNN